MKMMLCCLFLFLISTSLFGQDEVKIGKQIWMKTNLDVDQLSDGTIIPEAKSYQEWIQAGLQGKPAWCYFNNDPKNRILYGKIYNGYALKNLKIPDGFRIPTESDWKILIQFLGGKTQAGAKMKSSEIWEGTQQHLINSNQSQFQAFPGGVRYLTGDFRQFGITGFWWSISRVKKGQYMFIRLNHNSNEVHISQTPLADGLSVRCIKYK